MDGSQLPLVTQDKETLDLVERHAPIIMADEREPFTLIAAGYTIFDQETQSLSFPKRRVEWTSAGYPATRAIEYALWWDWDSGHLYELEHAWVFLDENNRVVAVEASWHGMFGPAEVDGSPVLDPSGHHPILLAQPGKHAMAASVQAFDEVREWAEQEVGLDAGKGGVLEPAMFVGSFGKTPENDALVTALLKSLAFTPAWQFTKELHVTRNMLMPWETMKEWIPARVQWWIEKIKERNQ